MGQMALVETVLQVPWSQAIQGFKGQDQNFALGMESYREPVQLPEKGSYILELTDSLA